MGNQDQMKIAVVLSGAPLPESFDVGQDGITIAKRLVIDLLPAEVRALTMAKALNPAELAVFACGSEKPESILRRAIALGADRAVYVGGFDWPLEPEAALEAAALKPLLAEYQLVIFADRGDSISLSPLPTACAQALSRISLGGIMDFQVTTEGLIVKRRLEKGKRQEVRVTLPTVLAILPDSEALAYPTLQGAMQAADSEIEELEIAYSLLARQFGTRLQTEYWQKSKLRPQTKLVWQPDSKLSGGKRLEMMAAGATEVKNGRQVSGTSAECAAAIVEYLQSEGFIEPLEAGGESEA